MCALRTYTYYSHRKRPTAVVCILYILRPQARSTLISCRVVHCRQTNSPVGTHSSDGIEGQRGRVKGPKSGKCQLPHNIHDEHHQRLRRADLNLTPVQVAHMVMTAGSLTSPPWHPNLPDALCHLPPTVRRCVNRSARAGHLWALTFT